MSNFSKILFFLIFCFQGFAFNLNYNCDFSVKFKYFATATWTFSLNEEKSNIFYFNKLENTNILDIKVNGISVNYNWINDFITLEYNFEDNQYEIEFSYETNLQNNLNEGIKAEAGENYYIVSTCSFPFGYKSILPVPKIENLNFLINYQIKALPNYSVIANGELTNESNTENYSLFTFQSSKPIKPYQFFFRICSMKEFEQNEISVNGKTITENIFPYPGQYSEAVNDYSITENTINILENYFGSVPYLNINLAVFDISKVISSPSIVSIGKNYINGDKSQSEKVVNGLAGLWWGSHFKINDYNHAFVTQGLKTYSEVIYMAETENNDENISKVDFCGNLLQSYDLGDTSLFEPLTSENEEDSFKHPYVLNNKSAYFFHMLRNYLGDEVFTKSLKKLNSIEKPFISDGNLLQYVFEDSSNKDLTKFFNQWLYYPSRPYLMYYLNNDGQNIIFETEQLQSQISSYFLPFQLIGETENLNGFISYRKQKHIFESNSEDLLQFDPYSNILKSSINNDESFIDDEIDFDTLLNIDEFPFSLTINPKDNYNFKSFVISSNGETKSTTFPGNIKFQESGSYLISVTGLKEDGTAITKYKNVIIPEIEKDVNNDGLLNGKDISIISKSISLKNLTGDINGSGETNFTDLKIAAKSLLQNSENTDLSNNSSDSCSILLETENESVKIGDSFKINARISSSLPLNSCVLRINYDKNAIKPLNTDYESDFGEVLYSKNNEELGILEILISNTENLESLNNQLLCSLNFIAISKSENIEISYANSEVYSYETNELVNFGNSNISLNSINEEIIYPIVLGENNNCKSELHILNPNNFTVSFNLIGFNKLGEQIGIYEIEMLKNRKKVLNVFETFENNLDLATLKVESSNHLPSFIEVKSENGDYSFAYPGSSNFIEKINVTHIDESSYWNTYLGVMANESASPNVKFKNALINDITTSNSSYYGRIVDIFENNQLPDNLGWGKLETENCKIASAEFFLRVKNGTHGAGLNLNNKTSKTLYFSHIDITNFWWTGIAIVNPNEEETTVNFQAFDKFGNEILNSDNFRGEISFQLSGNTKTVNLIENYFQQLLSPETAWIKVESTLPITGYEVFGSVEGSFADLAGGIESVTSGSYQQYIPINLDKFEGMWTGLALINTSVNYKANNITITGYSENGDEVGLKSISLNPNEKKVFLLRDIFSNSTLSKISWMKVDSSSEIAGFILFGNENMQQMSGINLLH